MQYIDQYVSFIGKIVLAADEIGLIGLWFEGQKYFGQGLSATCTEKETPLLKKTKRWLAIYFSGKKPGFDIPLHFIGTPFQINVWRILCSIPYGETRTYGEIAKLLVAQNEIKSTSPRAVGNAVGRNPISILVPCHRVIGKNGRLTGYAGGLDRKRKMLQLEKVKV